MDPLAAIKVTFFQECEEQLAELEGGLLAPAFEALLAGWAAQGHQLVAMATQFKQIGAAESTLLPTLPLCWGSLPGRSGELIVASAP